MPEELDESNTDSTVPKWMPEWFSKVILWQIGPSLSTPSNYMRAVLSTVMIIATGGTNLGPGYCSSLRVALFLVASCSTLIAIFLIPKEGRKSKYDLSTEAFGAWLAIMPIMKSLKTEGPYSGIAYMTLYASMIAFFGLVYRRLEQRRINNQSSLECPNA